MSWIDDFFKDTWEDVNTDIDFSKHKPIDVSSSLHVICEIYEINNTIYRLLYAVGDDLNSATIQMKK